MNKGEIVRKTIASASLIGAIGLGESALSYQKASISLKNQISSDYVSHASLVRTESYIEDDKGMMDSCITLGSILLLASGLSGSELTGRYIVRAVISSREQEGNTQ